MDREWVAPFLAELRATPNVAGACRKAGVSRQAAYKLRSEDEDFALEWDDAMGEACDDLIGAAWGRARSGEASDALTIFLLKSHRPEVYREAARLEHDGKVVIEVKYADGRTGLAPAAPGPEGNP